jgi:hypothetical protein
MDNNDTPLSNEQTIKFSNCDIPAIVSLEDTAYVQRFKWSAVKTKYRIYAIRSMPGNNKVKFHLAREIMGRMIGRELARGETVRHVNKNSLDCRRDNLILKGFK